MGQERSGDVRIQIPFFEWFAGLRADIRSVARASIDQTATHLPLHDITIRIVDNPKKVIPNHAHAGHTHSAQDVRIVVDSRFPNREHLLYVELPRSISHELHHAVRRKALPDESESLGAALVSEGLATLFETEVWGGEMSPWASAVPSVEIQRLLPDVAREWNSAEYNHRRWFYGSADLPRWAGYATGVFLVLEYIKLHPEATAASLVVTPASAIFESSIL